MIAVMTMPSEPSVSETQRPGQTGHDVGEDDERHAVADSALSDELAHPHDQHRTGGERAHDHDVEDDLRSAGTGEADAVAAEQEQVADGVEQRERERQIARILGDLVWPTSPSRASSCRLGTTAWSIWKMIELVM